MVGNLPMEPSGYEVPITMNDETQVQPEPEGKNAVKLLRAKRLKVLLLKYNKDILPRKLYKQLKSPIAKKSVNAVGIYACLRSWVYYLREYDEKRSRAIVYSIIKYLNSVSDDQLVEVCTLSKKDAYILDKCLCLPPIITPEERMEIHEKSKNSVLFLIFRCLNTLLEIVPKQRKYIKRLEMFRLKMILRSLQIPVLKLNALNEIARVLKDVTKSSRSLACGKHDKYLTKDKMKKWIFYNKVVSMIVHSFYQLEMWLPQSEDTKISENQSYNAEVLPSIEVLLFFVIKRRILTRHDVLTLWGVLNKWESELQMLRRIQLLRKATSPNSEERQVIPILEYWLRKPDYHEMTAREITFVFIVCGRLLTFKRCICRFLKFKYTRLFKFTVEHSSGDYVCNKGNPDLVIMSKEFFQETSVFGDKLEQLRKRLSGAQLSVVNASGKCEKRFLRSLEIKFMSDNYKDAQTKPYYWDLGFTSVQPMASSLLDDDELSLSKRLGNEDKSKAQIKGDEAEMKVFKMFVRALQKANTPSLVLGKYSYNQHLNQYLQICKGFGITFKGGDVDVLVSIPRIGIFVIEVKGINGDKFEKVKAFKKSKRIEPPVGKVKCALQQCERAVQVLAVVNYDILSEGNCAFFKVIAFPNCSKKSIEKLFCSNCCSHVMCKEDLESTETVLKWINNICYRNKNKLNPEWDRYDGHIYEKMKGRLVTQAFM